MEAAQPNGYYMTIKKNNRRDNNFIIIFLREIFTFISMFRWTVNKTCLAACLADRLAHCFPYIHSAVAARYGFSGTWLPACLVSREKKKGS